MKKTILTLGAATLAIAGVAHAQDQGPRQAGADRVLTKADYDARGAKMWQQLDVNGDGVVDEADHKIHAAERFAKADTDGNGELTQAEMKAAREAQRAERAERRGERRAERADRRFASLDTDKSGGLSQAELDAGREKMDAKRKGGERRGKMRRGGHREHGPMAMMREADSNRDKRLTREEFIAAHEKRFAAMDADGDGKVTAAERKAAREKMGGQRRQQR